MREGRLDLGGCVVSIGIRRIAATSSARISGSEESRLLGRERIGVWTATFSAGPQSPGALHTSDLMSPTQLPLPMEDTSSPMSDEEVDQLRFDLQTATDRNGARYDTQDPKEIVRRRHSQHRSDTWEREFATIGPRLPRLLADFASGQEVIPGHIDPVIESVAADTREADLFRLTTLLWSVPVSRGYGRRMRFLVRDRANGKVMGVFALGDPVFNLGARDRWLGWSADDRRDRLVNVMDAFVVGAVPPYTYLLGGKLIFSLIGAAEVGDLFAERYRNTTGIISGQRKSPRLAVVTVTSALGRSSIYNRLRLRDPDDASKWLVDLAPIGWTNGYGHFQVGDVLFMRLRRLLVDRGHAYANGHQYGDGPNWRMRVARVALAELGLNSDLQRHGIERQVYALPLAQNFREFLCRRESEPILSRPTASTIASAAIERWVLPRSVRDQRYKDFCLADLERLLRDPAAR